MVETTLVFMGEVEEYVKSKRTDAFMRNLKLKNKPKRELKKALKRLRERVGDAYESHYYEDLEEYANYFEL